jgi:fibrillarin-like rRNA methylase
MTHEELENLMLQYENYRKAPSQSSKQGSAVDDGERRIPIRPRESMKDILYNGVGVGEENTGGYRAGSRVFTDLPSGIVIT